MINIFAEGGLVQFLYLLPALALSLAIHEYGHAITAYKLGDKSQKALGRLTIAPFAHIDILGFISMMLIGIGWGKPVMIDDRNFKKRGLGNALVAIAGPAFNLALALIITIILKICLVFGAGPWFMTNSIGNIIYVIIQYTIIYNVSFALFNLIPLPPFDGSKVLYYFLPYNAKKWMDKLERYAIYIVAIIFITDIYWYISAPAYAGIFWLLNLILAL